MDKLAGKHKSVLAFDCEFWRANNRFLPRELGGFYITKNDNEWEYEGEFLVTFSPPPKQHISYVSSAFSIVGAQTRKKLDKIQNRIQNDHEDLDKESVETYLADSNVKKHHRPHSALKKFMTMYSKSLIVVKGKEDIDALKNACEEYGITYTHPAGVFDIAVWNSQSTKKCGTAKLEGTYKCLEKDLKHYDFLPLGKAHDPRSDAAMAFLIALYLA